MYDIIRIVNKALLFAAVMLIWKQQYLSKYNCLGRLV